MPTTTLSDNQNLAVHVMGTGKVCRFHLIVSNTDTNMESQFPQTAKLPVLLHATLSANLFPQGNYRVSALAWDSDKTSGIACLGGGAYKEFKIAPQKVTLAADTPKITDLTIKAGKSPIAKAYRSDETIVFMVLGNADNVDPKNTGKKCGWTLLLSDDKGASIKLKTGATFNSPQTSEVLTAFKPGNYTLTVKTTSNDDGLAPQSCLGKVSDGHRDHCHARINQGRETGGGGRAR